MRPVAPRLFVCWKAEIAFSMFEPKVASISPGEKRARSSRTCALSTEGPEALGPNVGVWAASFTFSALSVGVAGRLAVAAPAAGRNDRGNCECQQALFQCEGFFQFGYSAADWWIEAHI